MDVMFGLTVLQHQLIDLRQQLTDVQDHLDRIEARLDSPGMAEAAGEVHQAGNDRSGT
jgi:uncharacterized membrane protein